MINGIYFCLETLVTVFLLYVGDKYGTDNIWIVTISIIAMHFLIEAMCVGYRKFGNGIKNALFNKSNDDSNDSDDSDEDEDKSTTKKSKK